MKRMYDCYLARLRVSS